jgi:YHS domain-containing protein
MVRDIVCGLDVEEHTAYAQGLYSRFEGETYFFCCDECLQLFEQNPSQFISPAIDVEQPEPVSSSAPTTGPSGAARSSHPGARTRRRGKAVRSSGERKRAHGHKS